MLFRSNIIGIPLAAGVWIPIFGWTLNPMFGALAMSLSSFCVVTNALRLNLTDIYDKNKRYRIKDKYRVSGSSATDLSNAADDASMNDMEEHKEDENMTKTMKIEGMMCGHCEARVKKALEALAEVDSAEVSHEAGTAVVTLNQSVDDSVLSKAVEDQDYKVLSVE